MAKLYESIGQSGYKNLLADPQGADKIAIPCEPGSGAIPAGTVMYRKASGLWAPAPTAQVTASNQLAVLKDAVDTGEAPASGAKAVAEDAIAYRAGRFVAGTVTLASGAALTEANKAVLRGQGIVFSVKESTSTFTNSVTGATGTPGT